MLHPEYHHKSSISSDGSRPKIILADVHGFFTRAKALVFYPVIVFFLILPFLKWGGERMFFLFVEKRQFTLFGFDFNAQDVYLIFFVLTGLAFVLFFVTAVLGRVWCGWLCPQTLLLEGVYRKIERWIDGSKSEQLKRLTHSTSDQWKRTFAKYVSYVFLSIFFSLVTVYYFIPWSYYQEMWTQGPQTHPIVISWIMILFALLMLDFSWFREQVCVILCPYGRLQSALTDDDTIVIGYDESRGEPRGKLGKATGDCIDCHRCVEVCPTGIDIRNGLQLECVGCANCIDACDEIMEKVGKSKGLIRYDSLNGLLGKEKKILRPRVYVYTLLLLIGMTVFGLGLRSRNNFESHLLRAAGSPYTLEDQSIQNIFELHLVNKSRQVQHLILQNQNEDYWNVVLPIEQVELNPFADLRMPVIVRISRLDYQGQKEIVIHVINENDWSVQQAKNIFLGP
ncbi:MAG: cytochrome c oxidase accessory protein CcoG [Bdellovibrionota bacterium]